MNINKKKYEGELKNGKPHGYGMDLYHNNDVYKGQFIKGRKHGFGLYIYSDGTKYYGEFKNNRKNGKGMVTYSNGHKYKGDWKTGEKYGIGVYTYGSGDRYEGEWKDNQFHGIGIYTYADGEKYEGEWKNGQKNGIGKYYYSGDEIYQGEWKDDDKNGIGIYFYSDGDVYEGEWRDDKADGLGTVTSVTGSKYVGEWKDGHKNGIGILRNGQGEIYEGEWKNNEKNGKGRFTTSDGLKLEGLWKNDEFLGKESNKIEGETNFKNEFRNNFVMNEEFYTNINCSQYDSDILKTNPTCMNNSKINGLKCVSNIELDFKPTKKQNTIVLDSLTTLKKIYLESSHNLQKFIEKENRIINNLREIVLNNSNYLNTDKMRLVSEKIQNIKEANHEKRIELERNVNELKEQNREIVDWVMDNLIEPNLCNICLEKPAEVISAPCGHKMFCKDHSEQFVNQICPLCKKIILCFIEKIYES